MPGAGSSPAGVGPAGHDAPAPGSAALEQAEFAATKFDGATKDFVLLEDGRWEAVHPVDQKVALSLLIRRGSISGAPDVGHTLRDVEYVGGVSFEADVRDRILNAFPLADMIANGDVETVAITIETNSSGFAVAYDYFNLRLDPERRQRLRRSAVI